MELKKAYNGANIICNNNISRGSIIGNSILIIEIVKGWRKSQNCI